MVHFFNPDEDAIHRSNHWNQVALNRVRNIQVWEKVCKTLQKCFSPKTEFEKKVAACPSEMHYCCTCCYLADFDNLNPIIFCDTCDTGFHEKCYGIPPETEVEDSPKEQTLSAKSHTCDLCVARVKKRKDLNEIKCHICKKAKGMMKQDCGDFEDL